MPLRLLLLFVVGSCLGASSIWASIVWLMIVGGRSSFVAQAREAACTDGRRSDPNYRLVVSRPFERFFGPKFWVRPMLLELCFGLATAALYWMEIEALAWNIAPDWPGIRPERGNAFVAILHCQFAIHIGLIVLMTVATFIDIDEQTIPDSLSIPGTIAALLIAALFRPRCCLRYSINLPPTASDLVTPLRFDFPDVARHFLDSAASLAIALSIYLAWCFGLLPRPPAPGRRRFEIVACNVASDRCSAGVRAAFYRWQ